MVSVSLHLLHFGHNKLTADTLTVCAFFVTHTKKAVRMKLPRLYVPRSEDFQVYLVDNASINIFPMENSLRANIFAGYFHGVSNLFHKCWLHMSKVIGNSHRWDFFPNNFSLFCSHCYFGALYGINFKEAV